MKNQIKQKNETQNKKKKQTKQRVGIHRKTQTKMNEWLD